MAVIERKGPVDEWVRILEYTNFHLHMFLELCIK